MYTYDPIKKELVKVVPQADVISEAQSDLASLKEKLAQLNMEIAVHQASIDKDTPVRDEIALKVSEIESALLQAGVFSDVIL